MLGEVCAHRGSRMVGANKNALRRRENWEQIGTKNSGLGILEGSQDANVHSLTLDCCVLSSDAILSS